MPYITYAQYQAYGLTEVPQAQFDGMASRASDVIDAYTFRAIARFALMDDELYAERIRKAAAYQVEHIHLSGGLRAWASDVGRLSGKSETIGGYSYSKSYDVSAANGEGVRVNGLSLAPPSVSLLADVVALGRRIR